MLNWGIWKNKRTVGLEIKDTIIKLVELERTGEDVQIKKFYSEPIPAGVVTAGQIVDQDHFFEILFLMKEKTGLKNQSIHLAIDCQQVLLRPLQISNAPKKELRKAIELEIENQIQPPFDEYVFDFSILNDVETGDGEERLELMLVIAPKAYITSYVDLLRELDLNPKSVDLGPLSVVRALRANEAWALDRTFMIINVGDKSTEVSIVHDRVLKMVRSFALDVHAFLYDSDHSTTDARDFVEIQEQRSMIQSFANEMGGELERIINFYLYTLNNRDQQIAQVILVGEITNLHELADYLSIRLNLQVLVEGIREQYIAPSLRDQFGPQSPSFVVPFGLALKDVN
ncbi:hypothetical protein BEP19_05545 [Ammoniphilus oxalaticus]|uniref:Pilus assembly protein PilM n=1 Tax=Ammoniphilus oxalaticus TaxID=66863 RepID=A0A419SIQ1_9BACL|nr:type IV pilus assembly protein PilM [Ammoniphilus oxalaticus]RKD23891.1 hypothetical protein BEP19_05545 [Ammoniphilus oxalaticus]